MKIISLMFLCNSLFFSSCALATNTSNKTTSKSSAELLVEITTTNTSELSSIRGKIVDFKLFEDGRLDFESYPSDLRSDSQINVDSVKTQNETKIDESELSEIRRILQSAEFQNLKEDYEKVSQSCDAVPTVEVTTEFKHISIVWCDSLRSPLSSPEFPAILSSFFRETDRLKSVKFGEDSEK